MQFLKVIVFPLLSLSATLIAFAQERLEPIHPSVIEPKLWYLNRVAIDTTAPSSPLGVAVPELLDVRGVGDSSWTRGAKPRAGLPTPPPAAFGKALSSFDPSGLILKGDLNFLNWESVVGERCQSIRRSVDFYFLSHPNAIRQAVDRGFNLFSLSNNHAQDCNLGRSTQDSPLAHGPIMSGQNMSRIQKDSALTLNWAGVATSPTAGDAFQVRVVPFQIGGRTVRVALGAVATFNWEVKNAATILTTGAPNEIRKFQQMLEDFRTVDADFRILSIHTQDSSGSGRAEGPAFKMLKKLAEQFILEASGDVVFGHGPHTWGGVKVLPKRDGKLGVIFTSLGNFIHQGLRTDVDNYIGRALWDRDTLELREVQVHPFQNVRTTIETYSIPASTKPPLSNFTWNTMLSKPYDQTIVGYSARFK